MPPFHCTENKIEYENTGGINEKTHSSHLYEER